MAGKWQHVSKNIFWLETKSSKYVQKKITIYFCTSLSFHCIVFFYLTMMQIKHIFFTITSLSSVFFFITCWQELIGVDNLCGLNGLWADTKKYHGWYIMKLIAVMSCEPSNYLCSASFPLFLCIIPFVKTLYLYSPRWRDMSWMSGNWVPAACSRGEGEGEILLWNQTIDWQLRY